MYSDHTGNTAVASADRAMEPLKKRRYREGLTICKQLGCTRVVDGKCLGWKDPLYMWEHFGECPYLSDDPELVSEIEKACKEYQEYMDGRGDLVGEKAEVSH